MYTILSQSSLQILERLSFVRMSVYANEKRSIARALRAPSFIRGMQLSIFPNSSFSALGQCEKWAFFVAIFSHLVSYNGIRFGIWDILPVCHYGLWNLEWDFIEGEIHESNENFLHNWVFEEGNGTFVSNLSIKESGINRFISVDLNT